MSTITVELNQNKEPIQKRWWNTDENEMFRDVFGVLSSIETSQSYRHDMNLRYARLYSNMEMIGFYGTQFMRSTAFPSIDGRITLNVIKSCVDTATSRIGKNHPKPLFLTDKGNYQQQTKSKGLTKYVYGVFESGKVYQEGTSAFTHGTVMGTGGLKFFQNKEEKKIECERVLIDEITVDDAEGLHGKPRSLYQTKYMDRDLVLELFGKDKKLKDEIRAATGGIPNETATSADQIKVVEAWHLPPSKKSTQGRHTICIENATLSMEEWKKMYFPFAWFRWSPRLLGFYGAGIPEELMSIQIQINRILRNIEESIRLHAIPRVWLEDGAKVATIINKVGSIHKYRGQRPVFETPPAMAPDVYMYLESLVRKAFEQIGLSQMSAQSKKPAGLDSGVSIREWNDTETERFAVVAQCYEQMYMDAAYIITDQSRDLFLEDNNLSVNVKGSKFIESIKWKDVDIEEDKFIMDIFPTSLLPTQPSGRLAKVQELMQAGFIDKEMGLSLLDFPDLQAYMGLANANINITKKMIDTMLEDGVYTSPEPFMNLEGAIKMTQAAYLEAKEASVPEHRLELLRRFMDDCEYMLGGPEEPMPAMDPAMMAAAQGGGIDPMTGQPMAVPAAPPVSDLLQTMPMQ